MKRDCSPAKLKAYKGLKQPTCSCAACWKKYATILMKTQPEDYLFEAQTAAQNFFWYRFSQLVYEVEDIFPEEDQPDIRIQIGDMSSVYGIADR